MKASDKSVIFKDFSSVLVFANKTDFVSGEITGLGNYDNTLRSHHTNSCRPFHSLTSHQRCHNPLWQPQQKSPFFGSTFVSPRCGASAVMHLVRMSTSSGNVCWTAMDENLELPCFYKSDTFTSAFDLSA